MIGYKRKTVFARGTCFVINGTVQSWHLSVIRHIIINYYVSTWSQCWWTLSQKIKQIKQRMSHVSVLGDHKKIAESLIETWYADCHVFVAPYDTCDCLFSREGMFSTGHPHFRTHRNGNCFATEQQPQTVTWCLPQHCPATPPACMSHGRKQQVLRRIASWSPPSSSGDNLVGLTKALTSSSGPLMTKSIPLVGSVLMFKVQGLCVI